MMSYGGKWNQRSSDTIEQVDINCMRRHEYRGLLHQAFACSQEFQEFKFFFKDEDDVVARVKQVRSQRRDPLPPCHFVPCSVV